MAADGDGHANEDNAECDQLNRINDHWHKPDNIMKSNNDRDSRTTMPIAMLMITTTKMTTMMRRKPVSTAMFLCENRAGTSAIIRIEITKCPDHQCAVRNEYHDTH
jgi:hypothetical protein